MEADIRQGRYFGRQDCKERTFQDLFDRLIERELSKDPEYCKRLKKQLVWWNKHLKNYYLCHITPSIISELKDKLLQKKTPRGNLRTQSTANRYLAALSGVFTIAVKEWNMLKENPLSKISRYKENKPRERFLSVEEVETLLAVCKNSKSPHLYAVTLFALSTGARKGEILNLKWRDLDIERQTAVFRETKNGETRTISLTPLIVNCILEEKKKRVILSEYVFPSNDGKSPADIRTAWDK